MITAEAPPLAHPGAAIDVLRALPRELRSRGHEVSVVLPYYREVQRNASVVAESTGIAVDIPVGKSTHTAELVEWRTPEGMQVFFIRCDEFFDRDGIYGVHGVPHPDNSARFIFFNKAAIELARRMTPTPTILHCHDWAAALVPVLVYERGLPFSTVLTIHRLGDQGSFWGPDFEFTNLPKRYFTLTGIEFYGRMNLLKGGILYADRITVASEHFRRDMQTPECGFALDGVLRENAHRLVAIRNGADYSRWDPATDVLLPRNYSINEPFGKTACRDALLSELNLTPGPRGPVFGMVTRLVPDKGFDLLIPLLDRLLSDDTRFIILGEGDPAFETALAIIAKKYSRKFAYRSVYDERLAHLIEAGTDITLIPSRPEPGGLSAMYSLKYGALPIGRASGALEEVVEDYDPSADSGYGFLYYHHTAEALWDAMKRASGMFQQRNLWLELMRRAMTRAFPWKEAVAGYENLYEQLSTKLPKASAA